MILRVIAPLLGGTLVWCGATTPTATAHNVSPTANVSAPASEPSAAPSPAVKAEEKQPYNKYQCGNVGSKVFLTFDDTARNKSEFKKLVDKAARLNVGIGIVPNGNAVKAGRVSVSYARSKGMPVIEHTYDHPLLTQLSRKKIVKQITHPYINSNYVRPPYGAHNAKVRKVLKDKGKYNCLWNLDPKDWAKDSTPKKAADYIIKYARKGSTVVVHLQHLGKDAMQLSRIKKGLAKRGIKLCAPMEAPTPNELPSVLCS